MEFRKILLERREICKIGIMNSYLRGTAQNHQEQQEQLYFATFVRAQNDEAALSTDPAVEKALKDLGGKVSGAIQLLGDDERDGVNKTARDTKLEKHNSEGEVKTSFRDKLNARKALLKKKVLAEIDTAYAAAEKLGAGMTEEQQNLYLAGMDFVGELFWKVFDQIKDVLKKVVKVIMEAIEAIVKWVTAAFSAITNVFSGTVIEHHTRVTTIT